MESSDYA